MAKLTCLVIRQPYASLIALGHKRWEFRSYGVKRRGLIGVAASPSRPLLTMNSELNSILHLLPTGVVLATANLSSSFYVTAADIERKITEPVRVTLHGHTVTTADQPLGEPLEDLQAALKNKNWESFAWLLEDVKPLRTPIHITRSGASTWTSLEFTGDTIE